MRIRISHETTFNHAPAARSTIANLRLTPRSFESQYVLRWRVSVDLDCALRSGEDTLGNIVHAFSYQKPVERFTIAAVGEVETNDSVGVVRGAPEMLAPEMFLRASPKTTANANLRDFTSAALAGGSDTLDRLHRLMGALHTEIALESDAADSRGGAAETLSLKRGSAADISHLFIAAARSIEIPARLVTGFVAPEQGEEPGRLDIWAEAFSPGLGWIAFDCTRDLCANERYVRVALGFDYASAQPIRIGHASGGADVVETLIRIQSVASQEQSQRF